MPNNEGIIVGIDMGGTRLRALAVDSENNILATRKALTDSTGRHMQILADLSSLVERVAQAAKVKHSDLLAVGLGAPGAVDPEGGVVHNAPNLGWKRVALGPRLEALVHVPVRVDNDVNVGVVGEHALGAGRGAQELVGIFVGTGIGGGIVSRGKLYHGSRGAAAEIGHTVLMVDGPRCACGSSGCVEALASRTAMERDVRAAIRAGEKSVISELMKERSKERMTSSIIQEALNKRDPVMRKVMRRAQYYLGILVANVVNTLDPECVVIGGGIAARLGEGFVGPIRETAYKYFLRRHDAKRVKVVPGLLGDDAGPLGAVVLTRQWMAKKK
jgi:glucokinase